MRTDDSTIVVEENRILIIEDDDNYRCYLVELLNNAGFKVQTAKNGKEAVKMLEDAVPDLILTDIVMPEMDGFELMKQITAKFVKVPIIAMSGYSKIESNVYLTMISMLGACEILQKPFKGKMLINLIIDVLNKFDKNSVEQAEV